MLRKWQFKWSWRAIAVGAIGCLYLILLVSQTYGDILITARQGMNFWHFFKEGELFSFFAKNICASGNNAYTSVFYAIYNILVYLIFAVWTLPLVLLQVGFQVDVLNNLLCLIYINLLPALFLALVVQTGRKIALQMTGTKKATNLFAALMLTSLLVIGPVMTIKQYDTIELFFILLGILAWLKHRHAGFVLLFAIAICMKFFAVLVFLPLLLLREKRPLPIIRDIAVCGAVYMVTTLPFQLFGESVSGVENATGTFVEMLKQSNFMDINLLGLGLVCVCLFSFLTSPKDREEESRFAIWLCTASFAVFFIVGGELHPYWIVLLAPFLSLLTAQSGMPRLYPNLVLDTIIGVFFAFKSMAHYSFCYWGLTMQPMLLAKLFPERVAALEQSKILELFYSIGYTLNAPVYFMFKSVFAGALIMLLWYNTPRVKQEVGCIGNLTQTQQEAGIKFVFCARIIASIVISLLPILSLWI